MPKPMTGLEKKEIIGWKGNRPILECDICGDRVINITAIRKHKKEEHAY